MIYGEEKVRQMVRSILPSTGAKKARENKAALNRKLRRNTRQSLKQIRSEEDWEEDTTDYWDDGQQERYMIVNIRRGADKVSHFQKWAEHRAADIPDGEKMDHIKSIIKGRGVIIDRAYTHLKWFDGFTKDTCLYRGRQWGYYRQSQKDEMTDAMIRETLQQILEDSWAHKRLNNILKFNAVTVTWYKYDTYISYYRPDGSPVYKDGYREVYKRGEPTLLLGTHNVEEFLNFVRRGNSYYIPNDGVHYRKHYNGKYFKISLPNPKHQPHLRDLVKLFIETYRDTDGDYKSLIELEQEFERRSWNKRRYYGSFNHKLQYNWTWE